MGHLTSEQFVDLAEGTCDEASVPHVLACEVCRRQLADLRLMLASAAAAPVRNIRSVGNAGSSKSDLSDGADISDVPEPSPLFWDHLSARVRDAVASEGVPPRATSPWSWPRVALGAVAGAFALAIVAALGSHAVAPGIATGTAPPPPQPPAVAQVAPLEPLGSPDDPSLSLVAEYGSTLDWDEMREQMAVSMHIGGTDETVADLNSGERQELQKLLKEALARPGAQTDRS